MASDIKSIKIDDFDYLLPQDRIALHPLARRDSCRLLVANPSGRINHSVFSNLPLFLKPETLIVINETRVIRARLQFVKETGAHIEIFLLEPLKPHDYVTSFASMGRCSWTCLVGNRKRWKEGVLKQNISVSGADVVLTAEMGEDIPGKGTEIIFSWNKLDVSFAEVIESAGNIPIPPYLNRESEESDTDDYQTVYSRIQGSVAAPTAGLHFTPELIEDLKRSGDEFATVTLHVGAGTFQPVKSDSIGGHPMHSEWISVSRNTLRRLVDALENGRDVLAVGTTSVRTLESLPYLGRLVEEGEHNLQVTQWMPYEERFRGMDTVRSLKSLLDYLEKTGREAVEADTSIMIAPGFRWRIVNRLVTNFHQPKSTLLLLVSSFLGGDVWRNVYTEALKEGYRFLSYGDACLFSRAPQRVQLPAAKSLVIRTATVDAAENPDKLDVLLRSGLCDDSEFYIKALKKVISSVALPQDQREEIFIGEGAAPLRFLTAFAASMPGAKVLVRCAPGLRRRPILPLISTMISLGADIEFNNDSADWWIRINGRRLEGGEVAIDTSFTSQFLSALMLASILWKSPLRLVEQNVTVSKPYVRMTERVIEKPRIEPDWSGAAFFYEYVLVSGKSVAISGLVPPASSLQGDAAVCDIFGSLGVNTLFVKEEGEKDVALVEFDPDSLALAKERDEIHFDFTDFPDLVPAVAVAMCYRGLPFRFTGVSHLRFKECDRLTALQTLLVRLGYEVGVAGDDSLVFNGSFTPLNEFPVEIDSYGDHRIAMAFYPLELAGMVRIENKDVVRKSFPDFYSQF